VLAGLPSVLSGFTRLIEEGVTLLRGLSGLGA